MEGGRKMQKVGDSETPAGPACPPKAVPGSGARARTERRKSFVQAAKAVIRSGL